MSVGEIFYILFSDESHPGSSVRDGFNMEKRSVVIFAFTLHYWMKWTILSIQKPC